MKKSDFIELRLMRHLILRWFFALILFLSAILFLLSFFKFIPVSDFIEFLKIWPWAIAYYSLIYILFLLHGFYMFRSIRFSRVIRIKLFEITGNNEKQKEIKIQKNLAVRKSFGYIGRKGGFVAIRMPDDLRSADLMEQQLPQLAEYLSQDYGFSANSWERIIINHHEYRLMKFKF